MCNGWDSEHIEALKTPQGLKLEDAARGSSPKTTSTSWCYSEREKPINRSSRILNVFFSQMPSFSFTRKFCLRAMCIDFFYAVHLLVAMVSRPIYGLFEPFRELFFVIWFSECLSIWCLCDLVLMKVRYIIDREQTVEVKTRLWLSIVLVVHRD